MTKEELRKEAEEQFNKSEYKDAFPANKESFMISMMDFWISGVQPREKRIKELKELLENTSLEDFNKSLKDIKNNYENYKYLTEDRLDYLQWKIKKLEQENTELKSVERMSIYSKLSDQLVKAEEIIKSMLSYMSKENIEGIYEIVQGAEDFLKRA